MKEVNIEQYNINRRAYLQYDGAKADNLILGQGK